MISWLQYFFGGFLSNRRAAECQWRSLGNTFLATVLAFALLVCGLTWGYQASFGTAYRAAGDFRAFLYETMEKLDFSVENGIATGETQINTYAGDKQAAHHLIVDLRDTQHLYVKFDLTCKAEGKPDITYAQYLAKPAYDQADYTTFVVAYTQEVLDLEANHQEYYAYLQSVTADPSAAAYQEDIAKSLSELEKTKPADYYEQIYLLYVSSYYPKLSLREYGTAAPTLHGYYFDLISGDAEGKLLALFRDKCYAGFTSGTRPLFVVGDYSGIDSLRGTVEEKADTLITAVFASGYQADYMMYAVNVFGLLLPVIALWLILFVFVRAVSRKRGIEATENFGGAAQLVGSFMLGGGVITAVLCFALSFVLSQTAVYYLSGIVLGLTLAIRSVLFLADSSLQGRS